jgi:hypothetical protein
MRALVIASVPVGSSRGTVSLIAVVSARLVVTLYETKLVPFP